MSRLARLLRLHGADVGSIATFDKLYNTNFLALDETDFNYWLACVHQDKAYGFPVPFAKTCLWKSLAQRISRYRWIELDRHDEVSNEMR